MLYRSYHALKQSDMYNSAGEPVWALHGALKSMCKLVAQIRPTHVVVALDPPGGCPFRKDILPEYKHGRSVPAPELISQLQEWPLLLAEAGIACDAVRGWEADDVLASLAAQNEQLGGTTLLCSADRDLLQLISATTSVVLPDATIVDGAFLQTKYGLSPAQYRELSALRGESSDNIAGIAGIGDKTATKALLALGSLVDGFDSDALVAAVGVKAAAKISDGYPTFIRNMKLNGLNRQLSVQPSLEAGRLPIDRIQAHAACTAKGLRVAAVSVPAAFG